MNYYSFHIGDFIAATVHLSPMEELAYRRLLDMYYDTERPIPKETNGVSRRLRLDTEVVINVLKEYFIETEEGWANARCDAEIAAYHAKCEAARLNGKLGGRPKKTQPKAKKTQSVNLANPAETGSKANQEPRTNNKTPLPPKGEFVLPDWIPADLWKDYLETRKVLKSPMTERAKQLAVKKLEELRADGFQPGAVLGQSIYNGWKGLFPLKETEKTNDWRSEVIYGG